jgi:hypothetical protein
VTPRRHVLDEAGPRGRLAEDLSRARVAVAMLRLGDAPSPGVEAPSPLLASIEVDLREDEPIAVFTPHVIAVDLYDADGRIVVVPPGAPTPPRA